MSNKLKTFFKRIFSNDKFPNKNEKRAEQVVDELFDIKVEESNEPGKMLLILDPKEEQEKNNIS